MIATSLIALTLLGCTPSLVMGAPVVVETTSVTFGSGSQFPESEYPSSGCQTMSGAGAYTYCFYGGWGGQPFAFDCPHGEKVTHFSGRAQNRLDALQIHCSDGSSSQLFGGQGGFAFQGPPAKDGFMNFVGVRANSEIDQIIYEPGFAFGGNGGTQYGARSEGGRCPLVGVEGRSGDRINALMLKFTCAAMDGGKSAAYISPTPWFGGVGGNQFNVFDCPYGSFIRRVNVRSANEIDAIQVECSDEARTTSQVFGGQGGIASVMEFGSPVSQLQVRAGGRVDGLIVANQTAGGNGGALNDVNGGCENAMWSGIQIKWQNRVDGIAFKFTCGARTGTLIASNQVPFEPTSTILDETTTFDGILVPQESNVPLPSHLPQHFEHGSGSSFDGVLVPAVSNTNTVNGVSVQTVDRTTTGSVNNVDGVTVVSGNTGSINTVNGVTGSVNNVNGVAVVPGNTGSINTVNGVTVVPGGTTTGSVNTVNGVVISDVPGVPAVPGLPITTANNLNTVIAPLN